MVYNLTHHSRLENTETRRGIQSIHSAVEQTKIADVSNRLKLMSLVFLAMYPRRAITNCKAK
jgi:hypothetical protein